MTKTSHAIATVVETDRLPKLLDFTNSKSKKAIDHGYIQGIQYLAPYNMSGRNVCAHASKGCAQVCLGWKSGHAYAGPVRDARTTRTKLLLTDRPTYLHKLDVEIAGLYCKVRRSGKNLCVRLNGSSDLAWELYKLVVGGRMLSIYEAWPTVQFVEYTKSYDRMMRFLRGDLPPNVHLTFSRSETNESQCHEILARGGNVAVVFDGLPERWWDREVIDGDAHDLRHLDPQGVIVGLLPKGAAFADRSGFVVRTRVASLLNDNERPTKPRRRKVARRDAKRVGSGLTRGRPPTTQAGYEKRLSRLIAQGDHEAAEALREYWRQRCAA